MHSRGCRSSKLWRSFHQVAPAVLHQHWIWIYRKRRQMLASASAWLSWKRSCYCDLAAVRLDCGRVLRNCTARVQLQCSQRLLLTSFATGHWLLDNSVVQLLKTVIVYFMVIVYFKIFPHCKYQHERSIWGELTLIMISYMIRCNQDQLHFDEGNFCLACCAGSDSYAAYF